MRRRKRKSYGIGLPPFTIPDFKNLDKIIPSAIMICMYFLYNL